MFLVLATLPWCAADTRDRNPHDFEKILTSIDNYMIAREEGDGIEGFEITKVFKDSQCPYVQEEVSGSHFLFYYWKRHSTYF